MKTKISKVPLLISMGGVLCCAPLLLSAAEVSATVSAPVPVAPAPESNPVAVSPPVSASVNVTDSAAPLPYGVADIVKLTRAQVSEDVILSYVQNSKSAFSVTPDDIVRLRNEGVSDRVINSMLDHHTKVMNSLPPQGVPASTSVYADNNVNAGTANTQPQQPPVEAPLAPSGGSSSYTIPYPAATAAYYGYYSPYPYYGYPYYGYYGGPVISFGFGYGHGGYYRGHYGGGYHGGYHGGHGGGGHGGHH